MRTDRLPDSWIKVLDLIQVECPSAIIAGGALRDLVLGKPVKDVDIFINRYGILCHSTLLNILNEFDPYIEYTDTYGRGGDIDCIIKFTYEDYSFEIIIGSDVTCDPKQFDTSICQIWTGVTTNKLGYSPFLYSNEFLDTVHTKHIKITNMARCSQDRIDRLKAKYPEYTIEEYTNDTPF